MYTIYMVYFGTSDKKSEHDTLCQNVFEKFFTGQSVTVSQGCLFLCIYMCMCIYFCVCVCVCLCLFGQCECEKQRIHNDQWLMREENPVVMILIEVCHMTSTWNTSCDQSQVDIYCIEPTLNFYINLKMALFLFIQGRIQRSICMHKMDYR